MSVIAIRGAREHNLRAIDLDLPRETLIVFTGPSGSGKSSLAFDTLHAEGQRRYLEALAVHGVSLRQPDVDGITGLPPTVALDQRPAPPSSRSTVGTLADVLPVLRVLFARAGTQHCPSCDAPIRPVTHDRIVARLLGSPEGARLTVEAPLGRPDDSAAVLEEVARSGFSRVRVGDGILRVEEVGELPRRTALSVVVDRIRVQRDHRERLHDAVRTAARAGRGVVVAVLDEGAEIFVDRPYCLACDRALPELQPSLLSFDSAAGACPDCAGAGCAACGETRLREEARAVRYEGRTLPDVLDLPVSELFALVASWPPGPVAVTPLEELARRLGVLVEVGLGHLPLARRTTEVSSGELQRLRLARQVGARLSGVLYVLDEPTAGLDDASAVVSLLRRLRDEGNTVLAVEHHPDVIAAADRVVEFGPGPGISGGRVVYEGDVAGLLAADTPTGRWLSGRERLEARPARRPTGWVEVTAAGRVHRLPRGVLAAITGPSGSGKTRLLDALAAAVPERITVDRGVVRRTPRSNPATWTGLWDIVRDLLAQTREAQVRGLDASAFSLAVRGGRCEACKGTGVRRVALDVLPDVFLPCDVCDGRRFASDVREVRWKGLSPDEILDLPAADAHAALAGHPKLEAILRALVDVGLGYLPLGQPGHTLSGGEAQRLKLARELARATRLGAAGLVYLLDDPTVGLHPADVAPLLGLLRRLVDEGATVWLATHHRELAAAADWRLVLDSPQAGDNL